MASRCTYYKIQTPVKPSVICSIWYTSSSSRPHLYNSAPLALSLFHEWVKLILPLAFPFHLRFQCIPQRVLSWLPHSLLLNSDVVAESFSTQYWLQITTTDWPDSWEWMILFIRADVVCRFPTTAKWEKWGLDRQRYSPQIWAWVSSWVNIRAQLFLLLGYCFSFTPNSFLFLTIQGGWSHSTDGFLGPQVWEGRPGRPVDRGSGRVLQVVSHWQSELCIRGGGELLPWRRTSQRRA